MDTITIKSLDELSIDTNTSIDTITLDWSNMNSGSYTMSPITVSDLTTTLTVSNGGTGSNTMPWIINDTLGLGNVSQQNKITVQGEGADIELNGQSIMSMIRNIQERLSMLEPCPEMEKDWDDLKQIRDQYDAKLAECREKHRAWQALKSMPKINPEDL